MITLRVPIADTWDAGDRLQVYTNFGSGAIDTDRPLLSRPAEIFPGKWPAKGYGRQPYGRGRHGDHRAGRRRGGLEPTTYCRTAYGRTPATMTVKVEVPADFGMYKFAATVVDRFGTVQEGSLQEIETIVSGAEPAPLKSFARAGYDGQTDIVTFDFERNVE